jgi:transposase
VKIPGLLTPLKECHRLQSFQGELYGKQYRFIVCSSDELDKRKEKKLVRAMGKELEEIKPVIKKLEKRDYYCEKDALEEINQVEKKLELSYKVCEEKRVLKRSTRGRPRKDESVQAETVYRLDVKVHEDNV